MQILVEKDDLVEEILDKYPSAAAFLQEKGIICFQCGEAVWGSIGEVIEKKEKNADEILEQLNIFLSQHYG